MTLLTIGYGGRAPQDFVRMLREAGVRTVADVRLRPDRAAMGAYSKARDPDRGIERLLGEAGIAYVSVLELGNVFMGHDDWATPFRRLLDAAGELLTERLLTLDGPVCLLCAEKQPEQCHRGLVAEWLVARGHEVEHLL
jgi:uncharacterized protein (DUF488 family)